MSRLCLDRKPRIGGLQPPACWIWCRAWWHSGSWSSDTSLRCRCMRRPAHRWQWGDPSVSQLSPQDIAKERPDEAAASDLSMLGEAWPVVTPKPGQIWLAEAGMVTKCNYNYFVGFLLKITPKTKNNLKHKGMKFQMVWPKLGSTVWFAQTPRPDASCLTCCI